MKKPLTALLFLLLAGNALHAQRFPFQLGVKGGLNLSNLVSNNKSYSDALRWSHKTGLQAGVFGTRILSPHWSLQAELLWNELGNQTDFSILTPDALIRYKYKTRLSYLSLPVLAKYQLLLSGLRIYAGPQISYNLSAKIKHDGAPAQDDTWNYHTLELSAIAGAEYELSHTHFVFSARYQRGITNAYKLKEEPSRRHTAFNFTVGYRLL